MNSKVVIEKMQKKHLNDIVILEKECFSTPWSYNSLKSETSKENSKFFVATFNENLAGYIGMNMVLDEGYIANLAVFNKYRNHGIGSLLIKRLFALAKDNKLSFLSLEVRSSNLKAIKLYNKYGFNQVGIRYKFYKRPDEDAIIMTKYF